MPITLQQLNATATAFQQSENELQLALNLYRANAQGRLDQAHQNPLQANLPRSSTFRHLVDSSKRIELANTFAQKVLNYQRDSIQLKAALQNTEGLPEELDVEMREMIFSIPSEEEFRKIKSNVDDIVLDADVLSAINRQRYPEVLSEYQDTVNSLVLCVENFAQSTHAWIDNYQGRAEAMNPRSSNYSVHSASIAARHELGLTQTFVEHLENGLNLEKEVRDQKVIFESVYPSESATLQEDPVRFNFESRQGTLAFAKQQCQRLESLIADLAAEGVSPAAAPETQSPAVQAPTVQPPVLQTAVPVARPTFSDRFSRLSLTKKVLLGTALAVPAVAGLCVLSGLIAARMVVSIPVSWPMLIRRLAGHQYTPNEILQHRGLSTLLGHSVVEALTNPSKKNAAYVLLTQAITVAATAATAGVGMGSFAVWYTALAISELGIMLTVTPDLNSVLEKADGMDTRNILPTTVSPARYIPANFRVE